MIDSAGSINVRRIPGSREVVVGLYWALPRAMIITFSDTDIG